MTDISIDFIDKWKFRKKKYKKDYVYNRNWSFWTFTILLLLLLPLIIPNQRPSEQIESSLEWLIAIISVIFAIFLQKWIDIIISPSKDDMLFIDNVETAYGEIFVQLEELEKNEELKNIKIQLMLNMPIIFTESEIDKLLLREKIENENSNFNLEKVKFLTWIEKIANNNHEIEIITLPFWEKNSNSVSISPVELYIKEYVSHEVDTRNNKKLYNREILYKNDELYDNNKKKFYEEVKYLRTAVVDSIFKFYNDVSAKKYKNIKIIESDQSEFFWQCALFRSKDKHLYKSIVTFVGSEYYKRNSPSVNFLRYNKNKTSISGGFISDDIEKYEWVEKTLIALYVPQVTNDIKVTSTHPIDAMVENIIRNKHNRVIALLENMPKNENNDNNHVISTIQCSDTNKKLLYPNRLLSYPFEDIKTLWHRNKIQNLNLKEKENILIFGSNIGEKIIPIICNSDIKIHLIDRNPIALLITAINMINNMDSENLTISFVNNSLELQDFKTFEIKFNEQKSQSIQSLKNSSTVLDDSLERIYMDLEKNLETLKQKNFEKLEIMFIDKFKEEKYNGIIVDVPLVENLTNKYKNMPSLYQQFYDDFFRFKKNILMKSLKLLKDGSEKQEKYKKPFISIMFSSLENIKNFEDYTYNIGYDILYKESVYEQKIEWIHYHLLKREK